MRNILDAVDKRMAITEAVSNNLKHTAARGSDKQLSREV